MFIHLRDDEASRPIFALCRNQNKTPSLPNKHKLLAISFPLSVQRIFFYCWMKKGRLVCTFGSP